jgi:hypothetical protein
MVKEQIEVESVSPDCKRDLASDEGESPSQFEQQIAEMDEQPAFELALFIVVGQGQEVEVVWILEDLLRHVGALGRQSVLEIVERLPFPGAQITLDHVDQDVAAPTVFDRGLQVPASDRGVLRLVEQDHMVAPRQLCSNLLHNWFVRPGGSKRSHVFERARAETFHTGKFVLQVMGQPIDDLRTPSLDVLALKNIPADRPVEKDKFPVDGQGGPDLGRPNAFLECLEELGIAGRRLKGGIHAPQGSTRIASDNATLSLAINN